MRVGLNAEHEVPDRLADAHPGDVVTTYLVESLDTALCGAICEAGYGKDPDLTGEIIFNSAAEAVDYLLACLRATATAR